MGSNMICENCGKEHDGSYGSGRFCCAKCARSFSTRKDNSNELKKTNCIVCGKEIYVNKRTSLFACKCEDCKIKTSKNQKLIKKITGSNCPICGKHLHYGESCNNNFCKKHNILQFKTLIKYFEFDETKLGTSDVEKEFYRVREVLYNLYKKEGLSSQEIAEKYKYPSYWNLPGKVFKYLEIPNKTVTEASVENYLNGKLDVTTPKQYKQEWHTTWDGKEVYLRSSYEIDFANELDSKHIKYDVECFRIKYFNTTTNDYRCAIPDFYLIDSNTIVEIKSTYTLDLQEMKDKVKAYREQGYNFKLILEHEEHTDLVI